MRGSWIRSLWRGLFCAQSLTWLVPQKNRFWGCFDACEIAPQAKDGSGRHKPGTRSLASRRHWSPGSGHWQRCALRANLTCHFDGPGFLQSHGAPWCSLQPVAILLKALLTETLERQCQCAVLVQLCRLLDMVH